MFKINRRVIVNLFLSCVWFLMVESLLCLSASLWATDHRRDLVDQEAPFRKPIRSLPLEKILESTFEKVTFFDDFPLGKETVRVSCMASQFISWEKENEPIMASVTYLKGKRDCIVPAGTYELISLTHFFLLMQNELSRNEQLCNVQGIMISFYAKNVALTVKKSRISGLLPFSSTQNVSQKGRHRALGVFWGKVAKSHSDVIAKHL